MATPETTDPAVELPEPADQDAQHPRQKAVTIGTVCKALQQEFPDISISKIRYLEDQKLLSPRRTQGGYRLYTQNDVQRLRTILRLQRDEFLPLRVIRQELAGGRVEREVTAAGRRRPLAAPRDRLDPRSGCSVLARGRGRGDRRRRRRSCANSWTSA